MKCKKKGLTLVELVVVMALVTIVGGMIMTLFLSQNENMRYVNDSTAIQDEARTILSALENDIRVAKNRDFSIITSGNRDMIYSYEVDATNKFAYYYDKATKSIVKAKHEASGYSDVVSISKSVKSITIDKDTSVAGSNEVYKIVLKMEKGKEVLEFKTTVSERN